MSACNSQHSCFISNLVNSTVVSVDQIGVVPWALFSWLIWLCIFLVYRRCFESLLARIGLDDNQTSRLVSSYWRISFALISIPFAFKSLSLSINDLVEPYDLLERRLPRLFAQDDQPVTETKVSYILLTGFFLNVVCEVCIDKGFRCVEFFVNELFTIFFICTFPLKCVLFGIALLATVNVEMICIESCKLMHSFSALTRSNRLRTLATCLFALDGVIWATIVFLVLPNYFIRSSLLKLQQRSDMSQMCLLVLMNISLCGFYLLQLFSSPLPRCIEQLVTQHGFDLETILYPSSGEDEDNEVLAFASSGKSEKNQENLRLVYHTVKCVIRIRRKLKRIRERNSKEKSE